ncbi:LPXTG cell wall anchor domain-containing protein [Streptomyces sp. NPDC046371]|uniref:LPXTG cell wall anchor domain-containing protein n=1 Tax=Streptomyces sp. NPDC046371 TaxID=3154916 RepID=UPI0033C3476C
MPSAQGLADVPHGTLEEEGAAPGNGDTGGSGGATPPANRPDPDGGLADTGSDTPVGLISGIAAAIAATGAALVWWMRRRRTVHQ